MGGRGAGRGPVGGRRLNIGEYRATGPAPRSPGKRYGPLPLVLPLLIFYPSKFGNFCLFSISSCFFHNLVNRYHEICLHPKFHSILSCRPPPDRFEVGKWKIYPFSASVQWQLSCFLYLPQCLITPLVWPLFYLLSRSKHHN